MNVPLPHFLLLQYIFFLCYFIFLVHWVFVAMCGLSLCCEWRLLSIEVLTLLVVVASLVVEHGP